jgi:hypothetical protein
LKKRSSIQNDFNPHLFVRFIFIVEAISSSSLNSAELLEYPRATGYTYRWHLGEHNGVMRKSKLSVSNGSPPNNIFFSPYPLHTTTAAWMNCCVSVSGSPAPQADVYFYFSLLHSLGQQEPKS